MTSTDPAEQLLRAIFGKPEAPKTEQFDPKLVEQAALTKVERNALRDVTFGFNYSHRLDAVVERIVLVHLTAVAPALRAEGARQVLAAMKRLPHRARADAHVAVAIDTVARIEKGETR